MRRFFLLAAALLGLVSEAQAQAPSQAPTPTTAQKLILLSGHQRVFALDGQPAAFSAYSARRLLRSYTGPLLRLRRASDSTEQDFFPLGNGDFPVGGANGAASFCASTTCLVSKWYDQSGNGRDAVQATTANQPQFTLTLAALNNRPAILAGDGTALSLATAASAASIWGSGGFYSTVIDFLGTAAGGGIFSHGIFAGIGNTSRIFMGVPASTTTGSFPDAAALAIGAHVFDILYSSASVSNTPTFAVDGANRTLSAPTQPVGTITAESGALTIASRAGSTGFPGYVAENIFFAALPSAGQLAALRASQKAYWGTP